MIVHVTESNSSVQLIPPNEWQGPAFLNEFWDLSWEKADRDLGFKHGHSDEEMQSQFVKVL